MVAQREPWRCSRNRRSHSPAGVFEPFGAPKLRSTGAGQTVRRLLEVLTLGECVGW